jgi:hypothetical protein
MIELKVADVDAPKAIYQKARVTIDGMQVMVKTQTNAPLASFVFTEVTEGEGRWDGLTEDGPLTIVVNKGCGCGGTRYRAKPGQS